MGHSLGEYAALMAAGSLSFASALEAVSARGHEMAALTMEDNGAMAAVFAPIAEIDRVVAAADGYVVVANVNSFSQAVIGGTTAAVTSVIDTFTQGGFTAVRIPVSHAFHTSIVAPVSAPLMDTLSRMDLRAPELPIVANVDGEFYPTGAAADAGMVLGTGACAASQGAGEAARQGVGGVPGWRDGSAPGVRPRVAAGWLSAQPLRAGAAAGLAERAAGRVGGL